MVARDRHQLAVVFGRPIATREVVFLAMMLAIFMASVEATIVATAMPTIVADLGGLRYFSWVFGAYLLTQAVTIPIYGRLADYFGRKTLIIIAILIFLAGSILSGFAHDMLALILFRAIQGIGAGGVQPVALTIVGDMYFGLERARVQGYLSTMWAFSAVIGPLLGAFLISHLGWPIIFWVNVPFGLACIAVVVRAYHENIERVAHTIDYLGSALLAAGVGTLMFVLVMLGNMPAGTAIALGGVAALLIACLLWHELHTPEPMMPLFLYRIRVIAVANPGNFLLGAMMMGITAFIPTFVQAAMGRSSIVAGLMLGSVFVGWTAGSISGARLQLRFSYRTVAITAAVPLLIGGGLLTLLHPDSNIALGFAGTMLLGLGFGTMNSVFVISTQGAVLGTARCRNLIEHLLTPSRPGHRLGNVRRGLQHRRLRAHPRRRARARRTRRPTPPRNHRPCRPRPRRQRHRAITPRRLPHPILPRHRNRAARAELAAETTGRTRTRRAVGPNGNGRP
jgi:MFS family permease